MCVYIIYLVTVVVSAGHSTPDLPILSALGRKECVGSLDARGARLPLSARFGNLRGLALLLLLNMNKSTPGSFFLFLLLRVL